MEKLKSILFSTRLMAILFLVYAASMACGTFIENEYNTETARIMVYNAWWFEAIHVFFLINFLGNIKRYQLYKKEKWATLLLHLAFIFILIGAFVTRYISFEGMMPIREGAVSNVFYSDKNFLTVFIDGDLDGQMKRKTVERPLMMSPQTNNDFSISDKFNKTPFEISYKNYIMDAKETVKADPKGVVYLKMVESGGGERHEHYLKEGEVQNIHNVLFALNIPTKGAININTTGADPTIEAPFDGEFMRMADQMRGSITKDSVQKLMFRSLYNVGGSQFVFPDQPVKGVKDFVSNNGYKNKMADNILVLKVRVGNEEKEIALQSSKGVQSEPKSIKVGSLDFTLFYGSKSYYLPFNIKLNDFIASKYPGTENSYSAYESKVTLLDGNQKIPARIYMNHILDHKGYRFFQASFDKDEKGTVLSVNHDFWGTWITYVGYFLLFFAMMAILFTKHSRFGDLRKKLEKIKEKKAKIATIIALLVYMGGFSQHSHQPGKFNFLDSIIKYKVSEKHAAQFGRLVIQDEGGRMKPINTFSSELLRKVSKSDTYNGLNSDQAFLSMTQYPTAWFEVPLIYIKKGNDSIRKIIGVKPDEKYAPFRAFFDERGNYKLSPYLDGAYKAANPDQFQKDFMEADKRIMLLNSALSGKILRIFPVPREKNNKWVSYLEINHATGTALDTIKNALPIYLDALSKASQNNEYTYANTFLVGMENYQKKFGSKVRPSEEKINSEILYNKYDIFKKLYYWYMISGVLMLIFTIVNIFFEKKAIRWVINAFQILIGLLFILHTAGLIVRWYISGHAPWSDAYESMIYVAWATMLFTQLLAGKAALLKLHPMGFLLLLLPNFKSRAPLVIASGTFVASMILMIAHWNWMDPAIANLQPVLNSYWLMIHVAVIVGSYGPFTLAMILGLVSLILMIFANSKNKEKMQLNIKEITYINEMALTVGLVMLTIGNFLGGQWANESWGRYWGWDPKETWALISIMVYAFVIHARFVPALRGIWTYNVMSVVAFYSIMMTYFGVNFYLTGLHSYASGDKVVTPVFVYYSLAFIFVLGFFSYLSYRKHLKKK